MPIKTKFFQTRWCGPDHRFNVRFTLFYDNPVADIPDRQIYFEIFWMSKSLRCLTEFERHD